MVCIILIGVIITLFIMYMNESVRDLEIQIDEVKLKIRYLNSMYEHYNE